MHRLVDGRDACFPSEALAVVRRCSRRGTMQTTVDLREALSEKFGYDRFNPGQVEVITRVLEGEDTLAILATGAGKSLCYQLPAVALDKLAIVVSPGLSRRIGTSLAREAEDEMGGEVHAIEGHTQRGRHGRVQGRQADRDA